jgi:hypothetical protein
MSYIQENLVRGEQVLYQARPHWWQWGRACLPLSCLLLLPALLITLWLDPAAGGLLMAGALLIAALLSAGPWVRVRFTEYAVTTRRVVTKRGIIVRDIRELPLDEIESSQIKESLMGRVLGFRRVILEEHDGPRRVFDYLARGQDFHEAVLEQISLGRTWREQHLSPPPPSPGARRELKAATSYSLPTPPPKPPGPKKAPPSSQINQAIHLIQQGQMAAAQQLLQQLIAQDDRNADLWYLMGLTHRDPAARRAAFVKALRLNPRHAQAQQALAQFGRP